MRIGVKSISLPGVSIKRSRIMACWSRKRMRIRRMIRRLTQGRIRQGKLLRGNMRGILRNGRKTLLSRLRNRERPWRISKLRTKRKRSSKRKSNTKGHLKSKKM